MSNRLEKGNSLLQKTISQIIANDLGDPRLAGVLITVTDVELSCDLKYAKVFVSVFGSDSKDVIEALQNAEGHIKSKLKNKVKFRVLPELHFVLDASEDYAEKINTILKDIKFTEEN